MVNKHIVINKHPDEHYSTYFNQKSGLFLRLEDKGFNEPLYSLHGPELLDISITNWCDKECTFCYRGSNQFGSNMSLQNYSHIISQAGALGVLQVALGGGNPNQHPDFGEILRITREQNNIVPSYTTNGRGLTSKILQASKKYCGAVAVSYYLPNNAFCSSLKLLKDNGIRTNVHFLLHAESLNTAISWLQAPPAFLTGINALIFLNYKPIGPGKKPDLVLNKAKNLGKFFKLINNGVFPFKLGFDSCSVSGIVRHLQVNPSLYDFCDGARFSAYISEDLRMFPCSFMSEKYSGEDLKRKSLTQIWKNSHLFKKYREHSPKGQCIDCSKYYLCRGGCNLMHKINLC